MDIDPDTKATFRVLLKTVTNICGACVMRTKIPFSHPPTECNLIDEANYRHLMTAIMYRRRPGYPNGSPPCFRCHILPMDPEDIHGPCVDGYVRPCTSPHLLAGVMYTCFYSAHHSNKVKEELDLKWESLQEYAEWLVAPNNGFGINSMWLLEWFRETYLDFIG